MILFVKQLALKLFIIMLSVLESDVLERMTFADEYKTHINLYN